MQIQSMPPIVNEHCRVLIVGSMPGEKSLQLQQYYGHPRNYFWPIMYALFGEGQAPSPHYEERIAFALAHRVALWDVIASCERIGSLDANIKGERANDFVSLVAAYPQLRCFVFNGSKAYTTFQRNYGHHEQFRSIAKLNLPSTSPIPTKQMRNLDDRIQAWSVLKEFC